MNDLVEKEIIRGLNELSKEDSDSDEYYKRLESIRKLHDIRVAETNLYYKIEEDEKRKDDRVDKWIGYGIDLIGIVLPIGFYGLWMKRGLKFEETGAFTSTTFRNLIGKFKVK